MPETKKVYDQLIRKIKEVTLLESCESVLSWDERVNMPPKGAEHRANQMALLARMSHELFTDPEIGRRLADLKDSDLAKGKDTPEAANIREIAYTYDKSVKVSKEWVEEYTRTTILSQNVWVEARKKNDFAMFLPHLKKVVELKKEYAGMVGYPNEPYDALLDDFEPGATVASVKETFGHFRSELVDLVNRIKESAVKPDGSVLTRDFPIEAQQAFGREAVTAIGYDLEAGRIDQTAHPFCSGFGPGDVRITTRFNKNFFPQAFFGLLHEAGHGIYGQNLPKEHFGTPMGRAVSLGIHESQSRMWENMVGRSRHAWQYFFPKAKEAFPQTLTGVSADDLYFAVNEVKPSLIRVEADEATYNLHIILRFELEHALLKGEIKIEDLPAAWNEKFEAFFAITPPDDASGCMQDIHWSAGYIGYFPTYTLGNLYAAQFFAKAQKDIPGLEIKFANGEFSPLKKWLSEQIHRRGRLYRADKLVEIVTGKALSHEPLMSYLKAKFTPLYRL